MRGFICTAFEFFRIYKSAAYQDEHLSVFHASYITACFKAPNDKIPVGKYFMPPTEIQNCKFYCNIAVLEVFLLK